MLPGLKNPAWVGNLATMSGYECRKLRMGRKFESAGEVHQAEAASRSLLLGQSPESKDQRLDQDVTQHHIPHRCGRRRQFEASLVQCPERASSRFRPATAVPATPSTSYSDSGGSSMA
jgi:hypothetical protein